jgi:hypothetical protein
VTAVRAEHDELVLLLTRLSDDLEECRTDSHRRLGSRRRRYEPRESFGERPLGTLLERWHYLSACADQQLRQALGWSVGANDMLDDVQRGQRRRMFVREACGARQRRVGLCGEIGAGED